MLPASTPQTSTLVLSRVGFCLPIFARCRISAELEPAFLFQSPTATCDFNRHALFVVARSEKDAMPS
jgi:hypothetical protein